VAVKAIPSALAPVRKTSPHDNASAYLPTSAAGVTPSVTHQATLVQGAQAGHAAGMCAECAEKARPTQAAGAPQAATQTPGYTIRQVNELSHYMRTETLRSLNDPLAVPKKFEETDFFAKQLEYAVLQTKKGRTLLNRPAKKMLAEEAIRQIAKRFRKEPDAVTLSDALALEGRDLAKVAGLSEEEVQRLKLSALGVAFHKEKPPAKAR